MENRIAASTERSDMANSITVYIKGKPVRYETTHWFPWFEKPVRKGMYVVGSDLLHVMQYWDGKHWIRGNKTLAEDQDMCWMGWTGKLL